VVLLRALRCASQMTTTPVSSTSPHTPSVSLARKLSSPNLGTALGDAGDAGEGSMATLGRGGTRWILETCAMALEHTPLQS
jgi:hypothetical protein